MLLLSSADFYQNLLFQKILSRTLSVTNSLEPDYVGPDLGPELFTNVISR